MNLKLRNALLTILAFYLCIIINTKASKVLEYNSMIEWWINTVILFSIIIPAIFTMSAKIKRVYQILLIPGFWVLHFLLTSISTLVLGIIKLDPDNLRTASEHRAVFIIASVPILIYVMNKSTIFSNKTI